ncbi:MAG: VCBS repeat-containing protein [Planctomycetes bacterium]|nr:VCBS repeat-containing protein [Planctomycetota bacterium]
MPSRIALTLVAFLAAMAQAASQDVYVAPGGTGSGGSSGDPMGSIQGAVDIVGAGGTIFVSPGAYVETVLVDPGNVYGSGSHGPASFTILGTGPGAVLQWPAMAVRAAAFNPAITTSSGKQGDFILWANGTSGLTLRNLAFDGNDDQYTGANTTSVAVSFRDGVGAIDECTIVGVQAGVTSGQQNGVGVLAEGGLTAVTITDCVLSAVQKSFVVIGSSAVATISGSTISGRGPTTSIAQNGVQFSFGGRGTVDNCVIEGLWYTPGSWTSSGVLAYDAGSPVAISNCTLRDAQTGIYWQGISVTSVDLAVTGCDFTEVAAASSGYDGIDVYDSAGTITGGAWQVANNTFNNLNGSGIWSNVSFGTVSGNYFNNNGAYYGYENATDDASGGNNWDGNTWSDWTSNPGYPLVYAVPGSAPSVDHNPSGGPFGFSTASAAAGTAPADVAAADLSGDGRLDLVTANAGSDDLSVLINNGAGGFGGLTLTVPLTPGDQPVGLAAGNLVAGGGVDLAVVSARARVVRVVANSGGLSVVSSIPTLGVQPSALAVCDLDGVLVDDVAVASQGTALSGGGAVEVILNGAAPVLLPAPAGGFLSPRGVACADLDGDGDSDVVATMSAFGSSPALIHNVLLYENSGGGAFLLSGLLSAAQNPAGLALGDLDGDGTPDIAVTAESSPGPAPGRVLVFLNQGLTPGSWNAATDFLAAGAFEGGLTPDDVALGDLGDDGLPGFFSRQDIVVTNAGSGNLTRFKSFDGAGFSAIQSFTAGLSPAALVVAELNGDHTLDMVVANAVSNDVTVLLALPAALAQKYGAGCPGTGGKIPQISGAGLPAYSNPAFGVILSDARPFSPALLGISLPPFVLTQTLTSGAGGAVVYLPIPPDVGAPLSGLNVFFQYFVYDPAGSYQGYMAFSDGLRIKLGN